jgi:hypothetical protein
MKIDDSTETKLAILKDSHQGRVSETGLTTKSGLVNSAQVSTKDNTFNERYNKLIASEIGQDVTRSHAIYAKQVPTSSSLRLIDNSI